MKAVLDDAGVLTISTTKTEGEPMPDYKIVGVGSIGVSTNPLDSVRNKILSAVIEDKVTTIGNYIFCNFSNLSSVTIPNSATSIGDDAFDGCKGLTSVTIPNSVMTIGGYAFYRCTGLTTITIPNSVTSIGVAAFGGCVGLASVTIPNLVTTIGDAVFSGCVGLTSVTIPNWVTTIGVRAFFQCTRLTTITIPNSVTTIGREAFEDCVGLTSITIPNSVTIIEQGVFSGCIGLTSMTIPNSVTTIVGNAFYGCTGLTTIEIPNSVTTIGGYAFYGCIGLTSITIPNSVTSIGNNTFDGCVGLTSVTIPNSATSIGALAFYRCTGLISIQVDADNKAYSSDDGILYNKDKTVLHTFPARKNETTFIIPNSVTTIESGAFESCIGLTSILIPNSVTTIGYLAFEGCIGIASILIPNSVMTIDYGAFSNCNGLKDVTVKWVTPIWIPSYLFFENVNIAAATLHVPVGTKALYAASDNWKDFGMIKETMAVTGETQSVGADGKGSVSLSLAIPSDATLTGSFDIQFPAGMTLDQDLTALSTELSGNSTLSITPKDNNIWQIQIGNNGLRSATAVEYRKIIDIAYKVDKTVANGEYEVLITNLDFTLSDESKIQEASLPVTITVDNTITSIQELQAETLAYLNNGTLHIQSPVAETVQVYSTSGVLLYNIQKPAGKANFPLNELKGSVLIVKGSSGWVKKIVKK